MGLPPAAARGACAPPGVGPARRQVVVDTDDVVRMLETSHPPTYYLPRAAFDPAVLVPVQRRTVCEWKGAAHYVDVVLPGAEPLREVGWWYPTPDARYPELTDRVALYAAPFDEVLIDGERVTPQPGLFTAAGSPRTWWDRSRARPAPGAGERRALVHDRVEWTSGRPEHGRMSTRDDHRPRERLRSRRGG